MCINSGGEFTCKCSKGNFYNTFDSKCQESKKYNVECANDPEECDADSGLTCKGSF